MHHVSIRTADIHRAIAFYQQLGFELEAQFTTGYTLACWMVGIPGRIDGRIELIQIPQPAATADAFGDEHYTGYYHVSFDLTAVTSSLPDWLAALRVRFEQAGQTEGKTDVNPSSLRVLLEPEQQMIGDRVYEVAFIADGDGLPLELIRAMNPPRDGHR